MNRAEAPEMGNKSGKAGQCRSPIHDSPRQEELDAAIASGMPLVLLASRFGFSKSALGRHRLKCVGRAIVRATARAAPPPPDLHEVEIFEDKLVAGLHALHARTLKLLDDAEVARDFRLVAALIGQARENIAQLAKWLPSREREPEIHVNFDETLLGPLRRTLPALEAERAELTTEAGALAEFVVSPEAAPDESPEPKRMLGPVNLTLRTFDVRRRIADE
jgi:hypothetical protein